MFLLQHEPPPNQGKHEAAEHLENCALRFRKKALDVVANSKVAQMLGPEAVSPAATESPSTADDVRRAAVG